MIFIYIPYANFKLVLDHIISLRLPKEYLNSDNCSFDINIVKIPTIRSLHVGAEAGAFRIKLYYVLRSVYFINTISLSECPYIDMSNTYNTYLTNLYN